MSLQKIASAESALVATVRTATAAVNAVATTTLDAAVAELRTALRRAHDRLENAALDVRNLIAEASDSFAGDAADMIEALAADVAAMTPPVATLPAPEESVDLGQLAAEHGVAVNRVYELVNTGPGESELRHTDTPVNRVGDAIANRLKDADVLSQPTSAEVEANNDFKEEIEAIERNRNGKPKSKRRKSS